MTAALVVLRDRSDGASTVRNGSAQTRLVQGILVQGISGGSMTQSHRNPLAGLRAEVTSGSGSARDDCW